MGEDQVACCGGGDGNTHMNVMLHELSGVSITSVTMATHSAHSPSRRYSIPRSAGHYPDNAVWTGSLQRFPPESPEPIYIQYMSTVRWLHAVAGLSGARGLPLSSLPLKILAPHPSLDFYV